MCSAIIIFDFDQTLIDTSKRHFKVYKYLSRKFKLSMLDYKSYLAKRLNGLSNKDVLIEQGLLNDEQEIAENEWKLIIEQKQYLLYDYPYAWSEQYLKQLSKRYHLWLVSLRSNKAGFYNEIKHLEWYQYFKKIIPVMHSEDNVFGKVSAVQRVQTSSYIFTAWVGDGPVDKAAAKILDIRFIDVESPLYHKQMEKLIIDVE